MYLIKDNSATDLKTKVDKPDPEGGLDLSS